MLSAAVVAGRQSSVVTADAALFVEVVVPPMQLFVVVVVQTAETAVCHGGCCSTLQCIMMAMAMWLIALAARLLRGMVAWLHGCMPWLHSKLCYNCMAGWRCMAARIAVVCSYPWLHGRYILPSCFHGLVALH
jgi:ABC-type transport system involved in cytochrome bd biosynthesis fused ATPase/permease subunit